MNRFFKKLAEIKSRGANFRKLAVFCFVVLVGVLLFFSITNATPSVEDVKRGVMGFVIELFVGMGEFCIKMAVFFLYFFIQLAKYNNYLDVPTVQLGWAMVRDVSNMFFVVVLLMIAIGTILGLEQYQWNKTLVKLILAAVFINFSNLICGIFIDVAHVFTITFVNAVAATAGGNLVKMFSMDQMYSVIYQQKFKAETAMETRLLVGAIAAFLFAVLAMLTMGAYLIVMIARVVVLWVLIILSPLAFILQVIPQTQAYSKEWWDRFGKQVVVAPIIVFFLWLAFATAGNGDIAVVGMALKMEPLSQELGPSVSVQGSTSDIADNQTATSWSSVTTWENMSNFLIAMALLFVGVGVVGKMGVVGGSAVSKATDFFKNVATVATGYAAGRWLARKGWETGKKGVVGTLGGLGKGVKTAAWYGFRGEHIANWGKRQVAGFHAWRKDTGRGPKIKYDEKGKAIGWERDEHGNVIMEEKKRGGVQKWFSKRAMADAESRKKLKRTEDFSKTQEELLQKRTSAIPNYLLMDKKAYSGGEDLARLRMGELEQEKARSDAKTQEFATQGKKAVGMNTRTKYRGGKLVEEEKERGSVTEQIARHKLEAERGEASLAQGLAEGRTKALGTEKFKTKAEQEAALKLRVEIAKTGEDKLREQARGRVLEDVEKWQVGGVGLLRALDFAEQGKKAAEEFVKGIKEKHLSIEFKKAAKDMARTLEEWNAKNLEQGHVDIRDLEMRIKQLGVNNPFIEAMRQAAKTSEAVAERTQAERMGVDISEDIIKNIPRGGGLPSTVISTLVKQTMSEFEQFERQDASKAAAMRIFTIAAKRKNGEELDLEDRRTALGSWMKVDSESWNDDVLESMMKLITANEEGKLTNQQEKDMAGSMQKLLNDAGFKYSQDNVTGKWKLDQGYDREFSALMQNMAATGGDTEAALAHLEISREQQKRIEAGEGGKRVDYWEIAGEKDGREDILMRSYKENQDYIQVAAREFKKNALSNGHYESGLNQEYDTERGIYRFNTAKAAEGGMITEISKRTPSEALRSQAHSWGTTDMNTGLMEKISSVMFNALTSNVHEDYEIRGMTPRTLMKLFGYHESETQVRKTEDGYAQLGGEKMKAKFTDEKTGELDGEAMNEHIIKDFLMPAIKGNAESFSYMMMRLFGSKREDLSKGQLKIQLENDVKITNVTDLVVEAEKAGVRGKELDELKKKAQEWMNGNVITEEKPNRGSSRDRQPGEKDSGD